ncbi:GNAT family N-acetyltransferase [Paenibacillus humicus]|uniref:GNAT family N-acetyltransferase n=1 Tax=Paenibacillus humicus TaxID=412861 RepID=UPI003D2AA4DF
MQHTLTQDKVELIEKSESDYMLDRMKAIQESPGNPEGVEIKHFGSAIALYSETMPWPAFNTVKGISADDFELLDDIIDFYRSRKRKVQFEIVPSRVNQGLLQGLAQRGLYQSGFHTSLYYPIEDNSKIELSDIYIKEITEEEFQIYAAIHCRSTGLSDDGIPHVARNNQILHGRPGWKFFLAMKDNIPSAKGVMHINHKVASLTFAGTLPEFRNSGLHNALIRRRIYEASMSNCSIVVGQAGYLTQSHRNMESVGMKIGYVRTTWTEQL